MIRTLYVLGVIVSVHSCSSALDMGSSFSLRIRLCWSASELGIRERLMRPQCPDVLQKWCFLISSLGEKTHSGMYKIFREIMFHAPVPLGLGMTMRCILVLIMLLTKHGPGCSTSKSILQFVVFQRIELWNFSLSVKGMLIIDR